MTPNMGMAAPKGTQAPQAGLAALAQPAQAPKGKSPENMGEIMALARRMSDAQLADVLQGKSLDVPQFAAMTEAMGRKQLRQAVQGQQAMAQPKQPNLKDRLMGEYAQEQMAQMAQAMPQVQQAPAMMATGGAIDANETADTGGGIAELPAPNMEAMTMADGGIVAFSAGDKVEDEEARNPLAFLNPGDLYDKLKGYIKEKQAAVPLTPLQAKLAAEKEKNAPEVVPAAPAAAALPPVDTGAKPDALGRFVAGAPAAPAVPAAVPAAPITGVGTAAGNQPYSIPSYEQLQSKRSEDYLKKLEGLTDKQRAGLDKIKEQGGGEALMQLAGAIMGSPNLAQAAAKGLPMVASTAAATRKEARAVENLANEYDLNLAKAREAAEKGDMALALQYQQLANQAKAQGDTAAYQQGMLGIYGQRNAMMKDQYDAVKIPGQLGKLYADATKEVKDKYGGMVPPSKQKQYAADIEAAYRKRAQAVGLGKYLDTYSPGATNPGFNLVQSVPKGAKVIDPFAED